MYYNTSIGELSALHSACLNGDIDKTEKLLKWDRAWANQRNENGMTPVQVVVVSTEGTVLEDLLNLLIYFGADPNSRSSVNGDTPLHSVISYGKYESAEVAVPILLRAGANPSITNKFRQSAIDAAIVHNYIELAQLLSDFRNDPSVLDEWEEKHGQQKKAPEKKEKEASPSPAQQSKSVNSMFLNAVIRGNKKGVEDLLSNGAAINYKNEEGLSALHYAVSRCASDRLAMTEFLVNNMADVNALTIENDTPLTLAIKKNHTEQEVYGIVKCLLDNGAQKDVTDLDGKTPLILAMERSQDTVVDLLSEGDKKPEPKPEPKKEPENTDPNEFEGPYHRVHELCQDSNLTHEERTKQLTTEFDKGVYINIRTKKEHDTCLFIACRREDKELVEYLLGKESTVDVQNMSKETPLSVTQKLGNKPIEDILLEAQRKQRARTRWRKAGIATAATKSKSCTFL